ncbi:Pho86p PWA37_003383 [Arxiozyma heterogenica]|uniref:Inorganic phosphate transporter PHO86 n=1 Tax=Arxiozyma heterogenica TaxID=278026 RepID=A0AAN8A8U6_9SACH|nr:hypothetical protein RI543_001853 [Kazachstania heterogenica]
MARVQNQVKIPRIKQVDAALDKPLDVDSPPTIFQTTLTPEYATAALNLSVDFIKQRQSLANKYLLLHPFVLSFITLIVLIIMIPRLVYPHGFLSVTQWLYHLFLLNKAHFFTMLISSTMLISLIFTLLSRLVETVYKAEVDKIVKSNGLPLFNVELNQLAQQKIPDETVLQNTNIIVYRNTPIALISVSESHVLSSDTSICVTISTLGCRKVYIKSGILGDLIDWAMIRTEKINNGKKSSCKLIIEVESIEHDLQKTLLSKGFKCFSRQRLRSNRILGGLFGIKKELWGVQFHIKSKQSQNSKK